MTTIPCAVDSATLDGLEVSANDAIAFGDQFVLDPALLLRLVGAARAANREEHRSPTSVHARRQWGQR